MSDYDSKFIEYCKALSSNDRFLEKQTSAWKAVEEFVRHHFSNTIVFVALFLLGGLSYFLLTTGFEFQESGNVFFGGFLICIVFLIVAICVYLVGRLRRLLGAVIFHAYVIDEITRKDCLEEIDSYEYHLHKSLESLSRSIKFDANRLCQCDPNESEKIEHIAEGLVEFSEELQTTQKELYALRDRRNEYYRDDLYDCAITKAVTEHHK